MDYKELLIKYIANVISCEGVDFIRAVHSEIEFTAEELKELDNLSSDASRLLEY